MTPGPMDEGRIDDLRMQARYARERHQLYRAKALGQRPTSPERLAELQRAREQAEERVRFAEVENRRAGEDGDPPAGAAEPL